MAKRWQRVSTPLQTVAAQAVAGTARRNFGWRDTLGRWLEQVQVDASDRSFSRFVLSRDTNFDRLFWEFYDLGLAWRREVAVGLYRRAGATNVPDVRGRIYYSKHAIINELIVQLGLHGHVASPRTDAMIESQLERQPGLLAWMQTYPEQYTPDVVVEVHADEDAFTFDAATVLGLYIKDQALYTGAAHLGMQLFPPDMQDRAQRAVTPLLHQFAKGLLWLPLECPPTWKCSCNVIRGLLNQPPANHPQETGALTIHRPTRPPSRPTTPPTPPTPPATPPASLGSGILAREFTPPGLPPITPITSIERGSRRTPPLDPWGDDRDDD